MYTPQTKPPFLKREHPSVISEEDGLDQVCLDSCALNPIVHHTRTPDLYGWMTRQLVLCSKVFDRKGVYIGRQWKNVVVPFNCVAFQLHVSSTLMSSSRRIEACVPYCHLSFHLSRGLLTTYGLLLFRHCLPVFSGF
jgi:hypothetical protein